VSFEWLFDLIEMKYELGFIIGIASFQLAQKSSNLMVFWLLINPLKLYQKSTLKTINLG